MTPLKIAQTIQNVILTRAAEVTSYTNWSEEFAASHIRELPSKLKATASWYQPIDPCSLPTDQLIELGFRQWSDSWGEGQQLFLIPLWLTPYLISEFPGSTISEEEGHIGKIVVADEDNDHRGGVVAYGIVVRTLLG